MCFEIYSLIFFTKHSASSFCILHLCTTVVKFRSPQSLNRAPKLQFSDRPLQIFYSGLVMGPHIIYSFQYYTLISDISSHMCDKLTAVIPKDSFLVTALKLS